MKRIAAPFILFLAAFFFFASAKSFAASSPAIAWPSQLFIPSINLNAAIRGVGTNVKGEMAVPTVRNTVGWFAFGAVPGETGSAVLDAHVYLAFKNLKNLKVGGAIWVMAQDGTWLRFAVSRIASYAYNEVPLNNLFDANDGKHLNLITCAGKWLPKRGTYDHRLVVYADLVG